jgi:hypothetical protein
MAGILSHILIYISPPVSESRLTVSQRVSEFTSGSVKGCSVTLQILIFISTSGNAKDGPCKSGFTFLGASNVSNEYS